MKSNTIKYVEMEIDASGMGCVNTNGGVNPDNGKSGSEEGYQNFIYPKSRGGQLYISANSIRGHLFKTEAKGVMLANKSGYNNNDGDTGEPVISKAEIGKITQRWASSYLGLIRGYMLTEKGGATVKRDSPLMITDFVNQIGSPNKSEVMVNHLAFDESGTKDKNSLFYQETWGDTHYKAKGAISIEKLRFISFDSRIGQQAVKFNENTKKHSAKEEISLYIESLIANLRTISQENELSEDITESIDVTYGRYKRKGTLFDYEEEGVLLNDAAVHAVVMETINRLKGFRIIKSKGFMNVDSVKVTLTAANKDESVETTLASDQVPSYELFYDHVEEDPC